MQELIARRQFTVTYIWLDIAFLLLYAGLLLYKKKKTSFFVGLIFGLVYFAVDYGIFHLALNTRSISPGHSLFKVLFWMSMSYGFTNFSWIWLAMDRDDHLFEWSLLIFSWWLMAPLIAGQIGCSQSPILIQRTTSSYHGGMAIMLFVGYLILIIYNLREKEKARRLPIPRLLLIGILIQFAWEFALLFGGIRSAGFASLSQKLRPLLINSLLETNLGMPYIYLIFIQFTRTWREDLSRRTPPLTFSQRVEENKLL